MRACKNFGRSGENLGSNPHFGVILAFLGPSERRGVCTGTGSVACVSKLAPQFTGEAGLGLNWHWSKELGSKLVGKCEHCVNRGSRPEGREVFPLCQIPSVP